MSATAAGTRTLDISGTRTVPMTRLVRVELRKMADTRAGMWLLIAIGLLTAGIIVIFYFAAQPSERTFVEFVMVAATPQGFVLPVLAILLITSEWTQRTALVSFTLEPVRSRLLIAKVIAALLFGLAALVLALTVATVATLLGGADDAWRNIGVDDIAKFGLLQVSGILQGLAYGLLFLNSAGAIVTFFLAPIVFGIVTSLWSALRDIAPWIDLGTAQRPLVEAANLSGEDWAQIAVASLVWIVLPLAVGTVRVLRREVK